MSEQEWRPSDEASYQAALEAVDLAHAAVKILGIDDGPVRDAPFADMLAAAETLRACAATHAELSDRRYRIQNPVRQFDPFNDRPVDPPRETNDGRAD